MTDEERQDCGNHAARNNGGNMDRSKQYKVAVLEQRGGEWVNMPADVEYVDSLKEAREHGKAAPVAIYAPGTYPGKDEPVETIIPEA